MKTAANSFGEYPECVPPTDGTIGILPPLENTEEVEDPCLSISLQLKEVIFQQKMKELNKLTSKKEETGYVQNIDSTFTKLNPIKNGHSLDLDGISTRNINGFIHTHLDDFETGEIDKKTGLPIINIIYRIFSPADIITFLTIAKQSSDISKVYATVITSSGDYTLKFTGNQSDIIGLKKADFYKEDYIKYMKRYTNKEQGFLNFIKDHIKVNGIELFKLQKPLFNNDIKIQHKTLNTKGKVITEEC